MITAPDLVELGPFSAPGAVPTPWVTALEALRRSQKYWLTTVRPGGRPHVTPLLATVALDGLCFATGSNEQKSKNLHRNPAAVMTTGVNTLTATDYVIEGRASLVVDASDLERGAARFESHFGWHLTEPDGSWYCMGDAIRRGDVEFWRVLPTLGFANADGHAFGQTRYVWDR